MEANAPLLLPPDVVLVPVAELPASVRERLKSDPEDWAITRPGLRTSSRVLDARAAGLVSEFRTPSTVVEAVLRYSRSRQADPESTLEEAYPLLASLFTAGFLVEEGDAERSAILPTLERGETFAGFEVLHCIHVLEDTELYQVRRGTATAALKLERLAGTGVSRTLEWEAAVLGYLDGREGPRRLAFGQEEDRSFLAVEWCPGIDAGNAAAGLRRAGDRAGLLALCRAVARAYARLHNLGVLHGDVHPRNVLVDAAGEARLIDFGLALWQGAPRGLRRPGRGGVAQFYEPEYAREALQDRRGLAASPLGEQYGVAVLLYLLATGTHYRDFQLARREMFRQIAEEPPLPFAEREIEPWPELEAVLARALAKEPDQRFPAMAALADALEAVPPPRPGSPGRTPAMAGLSEGVARALERVGLDGPMAAGLPPPPAASVVQGAAGIALGLYRMAQARRDAELLSLADLWITKASRASGDSAFYSQEVTPEKVGEVSPFYAAAGPSMVKALIAHACGDGPRFLRALSSFQAAARRPVPGPDLFQGRSGLVLACALLHDACREEPGPSAALRALGEGIAAGLWQELEARPAIAAQSPPPNLGMAHGWAGFLYSTLFLSRAAGTPLPPWLAGRLDELADQAIPWGRGLRWKWQDSTRRTGPMPTMPGMCNGSAGMVFLWTLAHRLLGEPRYLQLARGAAWNAWESPAGNGSLCCGLAGRAYALLRLYRHGEGSVWLERARELARRATEEIARSTEAPHSLYRGELGVAVVAVDLERPEEAAFPLIEEERWDGR